MTNYIKAYVKHKISEDNPDYFDKELMGKQVKVEYEFISELLAYFDNKIMKADSEQYFIKSLVKIIRKLYN